MQKSFTASLTTAFQMLPSHLTFQATAFDMDDEQKKQELQEKYDAYRKLVGKQRSLKNDGDAIVRELQKEGITQDTDMESIEGLGDLVHTILNRIGITEERFKKVLGLKECNCNARRKILNKLVRFRS